MGELEAGIDEGPSTVRPSEVLISGDDLISGDAVASL
jgi:hypothetical protein